MKYYVEERLADFKFWSGAIVNAELLSDDQMDLVEEILEETGPEDGWSDTAINDLFWHDFNIVINWLGYKDEECLVKDITNDEINEAQNWFDSVASDYDFFELAGFDKRSYIITNEDGEQEIDYDGAYDDFVEWWNNKSEIEQVEVFRNYK